MAPVEVSATAENRIKGMIRIRDSVRKLIELQTEDYPDSEIKAEQERLNALYDTFSKQYGLINSRANISAFSQDSSFSLLSALEVLGDEGPVSYTHLSPSFRSRSQRIVFSHTWEVEQMSQATRPNEDVYKRQDQGYALRHLHRPSGFRLGRQ